MRRCIFLLLASGLVATGAFIGYHHNREPNYNGRSLSQWHALYDERSVKPRVANADEAADAIRHIGTNAIPYYLKWIQIKQPKWRSKMDSIIGHLPLPQSCMDVMHGVIGGEVPWLKGGYAISGFEILGANASVAIPQLTRLMHDQSRESASQATLALAGLGKQGLPPLLSALADPVNPCRVEAVAAIYHIHHLGTDISAAVPVLIQCTQDKDSALALKAAQTLGHLKFDPQMTIPALTKCLYSTNSLVGFTAPFTLARFGKQAVPPLVEALANPDLPTRSSVVAALGGMGTNALPAVSELLKVLNDSNFSVRLAATNALMNIAPEALTKAPPP